MENLSQKNLNIHNDNLITEHSGHSEDAYHSENTIHKAYPIDPSRIVNKEFLKIDRFLCKICKNLLINMKKCNLCSSHFCNECIVNYKQNSSQYQTNNNLLNNLQNNSSQTNIQKNMEISENFYKMERDQYLSNNLKIEKYEKKEILLTPQNNNNLQNNGLNNNFNSSQDYCPICHTIDYKIEEGESYLIKFINDLMIICKFSLKGCQEVCYYSNILDHEKICKYREKLCENCLFTYDYENYYKHIIDCYQINDNGGDPTGKQKRILILIKAFDDKISKIKYDNKYGINSLKLEMQKNMNKLDEKIRTLEKYTSEQDYLIRTAGLEKFKLNSPLSIYAKNFKECQVYYYCRGGYNGCTRTGNVWGSNPYTSDSVLCLAALHSGHVTKEGGLFIVKKGGPLEAYVGSVKNGVSTQSYGSFDHMLILPSELDIKLTFSSNQCGPRIGVCKGKSNNCVEKGDVWGDNPFVRESNLCKAALHSGLITENGGIFMIEEAGTHGGYTGSTRNTITSLPCSSNRASIMIKPFLPY